ncbi:DUF6311 domain-containing protein [Massilia sp.]|uniref:DUF6311 domain-containing protein n=1 Tax=Massilia sp. TaxID=1882437 RepID=UPI0028A0B787|nr:DUF6311 domain-containing protein [Massilia sp.]
MTRPVPLASSPLPSSLPSSLPPVRPRIAPWRDPAGVPGLLLAALLALGYAWWLYSGALLRGDSPFWWRENADITQYVAGFNAFVHDAWHWPLLRLNSLNTPDGTLATFLDTVPLYAALLKLLHPGTGYWNPYGFWIALCFTLQGVGAWWICREACVRSWAVLAALALLLASFPALTFRISHTSLMSQWMLLFALAIYVRGTRRGRIATGAWMALLVSGFYINIYLFVMASAIFGADILRELKRFPAGRAALVRALRAPLLVYGLLFATMWITMLPLPNGAGGREWGFGYYSMNLLAPLHGGLLLQFPQPIAHGGQGEGYNYLGVFVLALAGCALVLRRRHDPAFWRRHRALLGVMVALTLYALSSTVHLGPVQLFSLHLPSVLDGITSTFRSSGRFFWPVGYALVVFAVLGAARHLRAGQAAALLAAVVALQLWDLREHNVRVRATVAQAEGKLIDTARWNAFLGTDIKALHHYPPFRCGQTAAAEALLPVMAYAVRHGYPLSTGYVARASKPCDNYGAEIARLPASTAVSFEKHTFPQQQDAERLMGPGALCADMGIVFLCRHGGSAPAAGTP